MKGSVLVRVSGNKLSVFLLGVLLLHAIPFAAMVEVFLGLLQVAATVISAWAITRVCLNRWFEFDHWALRFAGYCGLGLLFWSHLIFGLTLLGLAQPTILVGLLVLMGAISLIAMIVAIRGTTARHASDWLRNRLAARESQLFVLGVAAYMLWLILMAALPATSVDELTYHLEAPRQMLAAGGQVLFRDNIYAYYPQFGEMFFLFALPISGEPGAHLFHSIFALLCGLAIYGLLRPQVSRPHAVQGVAIFCSVPTVIVVGSWAYVDLTFTFYVLLALAGLVRYTETNARQWLILATLFAGACLSVKYTGLQIALLLSLLVLIEHLVSRRKSLPLAAGIIVAGAFVVGSPYLIRNWYLTGWPMFPFQTGPFQLAPGVNWDGERAQLLYSFFTGFGTAPEGIWGLLQAPVRVFVSARFYDLRLYEGIAGPVFLLTPFLFWRIRKERSLALLALFALLFIGYWTVTTQQVRFLLPVLALMSVLLAVGVDRWRHPLLQKLVWVLVIFNLALGINQTLKAQPFRLLAGEESLEQYRTRLMPLYPVYQSANQHLGSQDLVVMLGSSNVGYLMHRPWRGDFLFELFRIRRLLEAGGGPEEILAFLKSLDATHILLNEYLLAHPVAGLTPPERERMNDFLARKTHLIDRQGNYALYKLVDERRLTEN